MSLVLDIVIGILAIGGALLMVVSTVLMLRERDALSRINSLSPATGLGMPLIVLAAYLSDLSRRGFSLTTLIQVVVILIALLVVSSVASNVLARAAYLSGAPVHPDTDPQDLAEDPGR